MDAGAEDPFGAQRDADAVAVRARTLAWVAAVVDLAIGLTSTTFAGIALSRGEWQFESTYRSYYSAEEALESFGAAVILLAVGGVIATQAWSGRRPQSAPLALACLAATGLFQASVPQFLQEVGRWIRSGLLGNPGRVVHATTIAALTLGLNAAAWLAQHSTVARLSGAPRPVAETLALRSARICGAAAMLAGANGVVGFARAAAWQVAGPPGMRWFAAFALPIGAAGAFVGWGGHRAWRGAATEGAGVRDGLIRIAYGGGLAVMTIALWTLAYSQMIGDVNGRPYGPWLWVLLGAGGLALVGLLCGLAPLAIFGRLYAAADDAADRPPAA